MKKLLVIILTLFSLHSFAQDTTYVKVRGIPGAYNFSKNGDSLIFYVAGVRNALSVGTVVDLTPFLRKSDTADMLLPYATKDKLKEDSIALSNAMAPAFVNQSFDTSTRSLTMTRIDGTSQSVVIPKGTASGGAGLEFLSSSRTGNMISVMGDNGTTTTFSINNSDSATRAHLSDLDNYTLTSKTTSDSIAFQNSLSNKVDKVTGKGLSTEDYSTAEKNKLSGIATGAEVNVNPDWNAVSGDAQILNKPTIPDVSGKVNVSDTASMLNKYLRKIDTTGKWISPTVANATFATIANLNLKANDNAVVHTTGTESIGGAKTFTLPIMVNGLIQSQGTGYNGSASPTVFLTNTTASTGRKYGFNSSDGGIFQIFDVTAGNASRFVIDSIGRIGIGGAVPPNAGVEIMRPTEQLRLTYDATHYSSFTVNSAGDLTISGTSGKVTSASFIKSGATSSQFLMGDGSTKTFGITTGTVMDGKQAMDSFAVLRADNGKKLDTSYSQPIGMVYPFRATMTGDSATFYFPQSWLDTLAYKPDVWPLTGSPVVSSVDKFLGYSVADSLLFKVKGGYSGVINATNQNTGLGYLGFTDAGSQRSRGSFNTFLGAHAGSGINYSTGSTYIGQNARGTDSAINVIVIGSDALGTKNNQTVIGNVNTVETKLYGTILSNTDTLAKKKDLVNYVTLKNISDTLKSRTYANDSTAFVDGHLNQWDLYRTGNTVKILTTLPYDTSMFNFIVDNRDGSSANLKLRLVKYSASLIATVYWGDGDSTVLTGDSSTYHPIHTYAASGYYIGKIRVPTVSDMRELYLNDQTTTIKVAGIYGLNKLTSLGTFNVAYASLTSTIVDGLSFPTSLATLDLNHNSLSGFNPASTQNIVSLTLSSNNIVSSAQLNLSPIMTTLRMYSQSVGGSTWVSSDVNTMLQYIDSKPFNAGAKTLDIRQFNSAPPTGAGLTAKTNLTSEGWTVTTD